MTSKTIRQMMLETPKRTITIEKVDNGWTAKFWEANITLVFELPSGIDMVLHVCRYLDISDLDWDKADWQSAGQLLGFSVEEIGQINRGGGKATVDASDV